MKHSTTQDNYNQLSRWYEWIASSEKKLAEIGLQILNVQAGEKVLEIGFGIGQNIVAIAHSVSETGKVYGIDLSTGMCHTANIKIRHAGLSSRIKLNLGDAIDLPYMDGSFDAIFVSFTLEIFDEAEIPLVLTECKRVLRASGRLGVVSMENKDCSATRLYEWLRYRMPSIIDCRPLDARRCLDVAGFEIIESRENTLMGLPVSMITARKNG